MVINSIEQYRRADLILDALCEVGKVTYLRLISRERNLNLNTLRGVYCIIGWEYGVHPSKLAKMVRRSRSNIINQTNRYRSWLSIGDKMTVDCYDRVKRIVSTLI